MYSLYRALETDHHVEHSGPYGHPITLDFAGFQSVLLFAGGSGITFCAGILEELIEKSSRGESSNRDVTLVWFAAFLPRTRTESRDLADLSGAPGQVDEGSRMHRMVPLPVHLVDARCRNRNFSFSLNLSSR
jgi:hypothetical protein